MVIGDYFPQNTRIEAVRRGIEPGCVLYLHCPFTRPPKEKFLLVACVASVAWVVRHCGYKSDEYGGIRHNE